MKLLQISNFGRIHIQSMKILITECIACIHFIHQRLLLDIFNIQRRVLYPICKYFMVFTKWYICHLKILANIKQWWDLNLIYIIKTNSISLDQSRSNRYWLSYCRLFRLSTSFCQPVDVSRQSLNITSFFLIHIGSCIQL